MKSIPFTLRFFDSRQDYRNYLGSIKYRAKELIIQYHQELDDDDMDADAQHLNETDVQTLKVRLDELLYIELTSKLTTHTLEIQTVPGLLPEDFPAVNGRIELTVNPAARNVMRELVDQVKDQLRVAH